MKKQMIFIFLFYFLQASYSYSSPDSAQKSIPQSFKASKYKRATLVPRKLSKKINDPFKTFEIKTQAQIVHLPQIHFHPSSRGDDISITIKSQFQIFQTLLDYKNAGEDFVVFDENSTGADWTQLDIKIKDRIFTMSRLTNKEASLEELMNLAKRFFNKIPKYYEDLTRGQKIFVV